MMQVGRFVTVTGQVTFGRDEAMFERLLAFVAQLSTVLWGLVILTLVIRFVGIFLYRRTAARTALVGATGPSATLSAGSASTAVAAFAKVPHSVPRSRRTRMRSAAHVATRATNSAKA